MALSMQVRRTWAVLDEGGRVFVLLEGADAPAAAEDWASDGYHVEELPEHEFTFEVTADVA
ncbi:MAG TPA: hypothetical protein VM938_06990 [Acidimicrobiales bacterium]|nr:hypothetical protein [Acidimicrobiales bacterium]